MGPLKTITLKLRHLPALSSAREQLVPGVIGGRNRRLHPISLPIFSNKPEKPPFFIRSDNQNRGVGKTIRALGKLKDQAAPDRAFCRYPRIAQTAAMVKGIETAKRQ